MCSCLRSRLTSLDILNFAHYVTKIKRLSRVFCVRIVCIARNVNVMVYFFSLNKPQRARENERNMSTRATLTCTICTFSRAQKRTFHAFLTVISLRFSCVFRAFFCIVPSNSYPTCQPIVCLWLIL